MVSYSIDYLFNRVYDFLLWIKYTWLFTILNTEPEEYLKVQEVYKWDGLRDRGWFDDYFAAKYAPVPEAPEHISLWSKTLDAVGLSREQMVPDPSKDPTIAQSLPEDLKYCIAEYKNGLTSAELKERYEADYTFSDHVRDLFGIAPGDRDNDGVPDSYEASHRLNEKDIDSDHDGLPDPVELCYGSDSLNNDTDRDSVLDGRDEAPVDGLVSAHGNDADRDRVSDAMEAHFSMNAGQVDSDQDGIPDGMDTYPLDFNNLDPAGVFDFSKQTEGIQWQIQNPVLGLVSQLLSIMAIVGLIFAILFFLWFIYEYWHAQNHYEHHFNDSHGHGHGSHGKHEVVHEHAPAGIPGLAIGEYVTPQPPTHEEFEQHPRWAIIEGYMASDTEALWRIGIMESDAMLEEVLREKGYKGADVGEMLSNASFKTVQLAWDAHKIRNRIAHDGSKYPLTEREAKRAYALYEAVFKEMKAI